MYFPRAVKGFDKSRKKKKSFAGRWAQDTKKGKYPLTRNTV